MKFFTREDFEYNESWTITEVPFRDSKIMFVDNIYKHPMRVYEYLTSIGCIYAHKSSKNSRNGIDFMDGQMSLDNRWDLNRKYLLENIAKSYGIEVDHNQYSNTINQFKMILDFPGEGNFWHPHTDGKLNFITYMNPTHNMRSGTTIYKAISTKSKVFFMNIDTEHSTPWRTQKEFCEELCILDRFNCSVVFPGHWFHGQTIVDNFFKDTTRYTEVCFI
jgi:hypothetical protein